MEQVLRTHRGGTVLALSLAVMLASGCAIASTDMTSAVSPDFTGHTFRKIMVYAPHDDIGVRKQSESRVATQIREAGTEAIPAVDLIFVGEEMTDEAIAQACSDASIDGVLVFGTTDTGTTSTYVPPTYHTTSTATGTATSYGNTTYGTAHGQSTTYTSGGYNVSKPWARFSVKLIDVQTGKVAWIASARSSGNAWARGAHLVGSLGDHTVFRLKKDGMLIARAHPPKP